MTRTEIEWARAHEERTAELAAEARYARERLDLYKAKAYGPRLTSPARLRELQRSSELADVRLRLAQTAPSTPPQEVNGDGAHDVAEADRTDAPQDPESA